jgi:branched-chain amino acid transport system permease protein
MINRESGVFQTSYEGDMSLYPLPLAKRTVWVMLALLVLLPVPLQLMQNEHWMSIATTIALAAIGAIGLNILVGYTGSIRTSVLQTTLFLFSPGGGISFCG